MLIREKADLPQSHVTPCREALSLPNGAGSRAARLHR